MTDRRLRHVLLALTIVGIGVAGYLSYIHFEGIKPLCVPGGGCEKVQTSEWSKLGGISVAYIGLGGYLLILASLFVKGENGRFLTAALAIPGWAFSAYLTYHELFSVKAICYWCVGSFTVITLVTIFSVWRLLKGGDPEVLAPSVEEAAAQ